MADARPDTSTRALSDPQIAALQAVPTSLGQDFAAQRIARLAQRVAAVIDDTVAIARRQNHSWRILEVQLRTQPAPPTGDEFWMTADEASVAGEIRTAVIGGTARWTIVPFALSRTRRAVLVLAGDWGFASAPLTALADQVGAALQPARRSSATFQRSVHRLAQRLSKTHGVRPVSTAILETMATAVRARLGAIALAEGTERRLAVKATFGYPLALVEHMRIDPGEGVFGTALETGRVVRMPGSMPALTPTSRRSRYRTDSFIALPITAGDEVLAVVGVADRIDDRPFTRADLSALQALAAPAALALARERAAARADAYAHAAAVDPLSGLFNRRYFQVRLDEELQRARRHEAPIALLMLDVDDFKAVNDVYGHLAGDVVIKETAEIIRRAVRVFDVCTRFGGEEFAVIMPASTEENALTVAERIRVRVAAFRAAEPPLSDLRVSVSIGVELSRPGMAPSDLIRRADDALYTAKRSGKNRVHLFTDPLDRPAG